ncbi:MAG: beta-galactosidase [Bacteroidota bacterium]
MRVPGFKQIIIYFFTSLILFTSCINANQTNESDRSKPAIEADKFDQRLSDLRQRIETVAASLQQAEGLAKTAGNIDLQVAKYFAEYIAWELDHPDIMKEALAADDYFPHQETLTPEQRDQRYLEHIDRELTGAMAVLDQALQRLEEDDFRPAPEPISWRDMVYNDGNFRVDNRIVFPGGFTLLGWDFVDRDRNPEWTAEDEAASRGYLTEMRDMGVSTVDVNITVTGLITDQGTVDLSRISQQMEYIKSFEAKGLKVGIMLTWGGNETLEKLWPGITEHSGNGVNIDIDHPGTRELVRQVMEQLIPLTSGRPAVISYDLANEPFFYMDGWTDHTMKAYYTWLAKRHGSIESLNKAWNTSYETFEQIPPPNDRSRQNCSDGEWYDRVTFHNHRTASFFAFVASEIRRHDPDAVIHTKGQDNNSLGPKPWAVTDGIDREMMTPFVDLHGLDTRPLPVTEPRMAVIIDPDQDNANLNYDASIYSFHWLGQSFLYDYLTSLEPYRPIVDFEYHAFSINPIRVPDIGHGHASATLWMAHIHGLIGNAVWYWHRRYGPDPFPAEYFKWWIYASISTQPIVAAEYFQTMLQLNMFAEEVTALAKTPAQPIRLFVSKPSYIQNQRHIAALHRAYEAACFHDLPIGFITEDILMNSGISEDTKMIVIPDAQYVSAGALAVLRRAKLEGVELLRLGRQSITHDEYGVEHKDESVAFLEDMHVFDYASAPDLARQFERFIQPLAGQLPVTVKDSDGKSAFGIMRRYANLDGRSILLLVNLKPDATDVRLVNRHEKAVNGYDLLNHEKVQGDATHLPVKGVRLIELKE